MAADKLERMIERLAARPREAADKATLERAMSAYFRLWTANQLQARADVYQRGLFRFFWILCGAVVTIALGAVAYGSAIARLRRPLLVVFVLTIVVVPVLGMLFDLWRLSRIRKATPEERAVSPFLSGKRYLTPLFVDRIGEIIMRLMRNGFVQVGVAAAVVAVVVGGIVISESSSREGKTGTQYVKPEPAKEEQVKAAELAGVQKSYEMKDVKALANALGTVGYDAKVAAANYLGAIGDANSIAPLEKASSEWTGPKEENPFTKAVHAIEARIGRDKPIAAIAASSSNVTSASPVSVSQHVAQKVVVRVLAKETNEPLAKARIEVSSEEKKKEIITDKGGMALAEIEPNAKYSRILARYPGRVTMFMQWGEWRQDRISKVCVFGLGKGIIIGGVVLDPNGVPLEGVSVQVHTSMGGNADPSTEPVAGVGEKMLTDPNGRWRCDTIPPDMKNVGITFEHPKYQSRYANPSDAMREGLTDANYICRMEALPGGSLRGIVKAPDGSPVKGATIVRGTYAGVSGIERKVKTDEHGRFGFAHIDEGDMILTVRAKRYAPEIEAIPDDTAKELEIVLKPGHILKGTVVDSKDTPVNGATVRVEEWRSYRTLGNKAVTDANGRFEMNSLPADAFSMNIFKEGLHELQVSSIVADGTSRKFTLGEMLHVKGKVVDAETGRPIEKFMLIPGLGMESRGQNEISWQNLTDWVKTYTKGKYEYTFQFAGTKYGVKIVADGYTPMASSDIDANATDAVRDFALKRSIDVTGTILSPDGSPVEGAVVTALELSHGISISNGRFLNESELTTTKTDASGRFHIADPGGEYNVFAIAPSGIGRIDGATLRQTPVLKLQPWAKAMGKVVIGSGPAAGWQVDVNYDRTDEPGEMVISGGSVNTSDKGEFTVEQLLPGNVRVAAFNMKTGETSRYGRDSVLGDRRIARRVDLEAGQTTWVDLDGSGRTVKATLALPADLQDQSDKLLVECQIDRQLDYEGWIRLVPWPADVNTMSVAALARWEEGFYKSEAGKKAMEEESKQRGAWPGLEPKCSASEVTIEDVNVGSYYLVIRAYMNKANGKPEKDMAAWAYAEFTLSPAEVASRQTPLDLGEIRLHGKMKEGDIAPDVAIVDGKGGTFHLSDFKGKTILLVVPEMQVPVDGADTLDLRRICELVAGRSDAAVVVVCPASAADPLARASLRDLALTCPQGYFPEGYMKLFSLYQGNNTKAGFSSFIIGKDGVVISLGLKGEELKRKLEEALGK